MISADLKRIILAALRLDDWDITETTEARQVPGWDSLSHIGIVLAVERHFGVRFTRAEVLRLGTVGDLQRLIELKKPGRAA